jgi:hypothetical protein
MKVCDSGFSGVREYKEEAGSILVVKSTETFYSRPARNFSFF